MRTALPTSPEDVGIGSYLTVITTAPLLVLAHLDLSTTLPQPAPARAPPWFEEDLDQGSFDLDAELDQRALWRIS